MVRVYEVGNESNYAECAGLVMADEFLPLVSFNKNQFLEDNTDCDEPTSVDGIELADLLTHIPTKDNKVYTLTNCEDELVLPFTVKNGTGESFMDEDGVVEVSLSEETEGITFKQESFETGFGKEFKLTISKTDPLLEKEVELLFLAKDKDAPLDNKGELKDVLCGRIKIEFAKKKVKYEDLKIKVLDCRSNEIVPNAKVKKIILNGADSITTNFNLDLNKNLGKADSSNLIKQSQQALDGLGFNTHTPGNNYGNNGRAAYNAYWESRFPQMVKDKVIEKVSEGNPPDDMLCFIIEEYNSNFSTNDNGFINLKIPKYLLDKATTIQIGLKDHPILLEARTNDANTIVARQADTTGSGTGFNITWGDGTGGTVNQSTDWAGDFGWQMRQDNMHSEFKVSLEIPVKEKDDKFKAFDKELMSKFYEDENSAYHLVFYAMQWCQPVWDGITDNPSGEVGAITNDSYIQHADYHGMNMHLVTHWNDLGGVDLNGGKGYGMMEACPIGYNSKYRRANETWGAHRGFDLNAIIGADIFAIRGGVSTAEVSSSGTTHYKVNLQWKALSNGARNTIKYLHLSQQGRYTGHALTGQILGKAGRSGNLGWTSQWAGHVHINVGSYPNDNSLRYSSALLETNREYMDDYNIHVIPTNNLALVLPCKCQMGNPSQTGTYFSCDFNNQYAEKCWAAMELKCPAMRNMTNASTNPQQIRVIQAQLKNVGYYLSTENGTTPYILDNNIGENTNIAISNYKEREMGLQRDLINSELTQEFIDSLNENAPLPQ